MRTILKDPKPGDKFGTLTFVARDFNEEQRLRKLHEEQYGKMRWTPRKKAICVCDCGNIKTVNMHELIVGNVRSCGCLSSPDLTGKQFNNLIVLNLDPNYNSRDGRHKYYICRCKKCGNIKRVRSSDLISGRAKDCGCGKADRLGNGRLNDLSGKVFGHLHVVSRDETTGHKSGQHAYWACVCDLCNQIESVSSHSLMSGCKDRCKECSSIVHQSIGEKKIIEIFNTYHIVYENQFSPSDCIFPKTNWRLRYDFLVHGDIDYIVEFDGEQHFRPCGLWDDTQSFKERKERDEFKNKWCHDNGYPLIRVPYKRLNKLCIDDLNPNTSKFVITQ